MNIFELKLTTVPSSTLRALGVCAGIIVKSSIVTEKLVMQKSRPAMLADNFDRHVIIEIV